MTPITLDKSYRVEVELPLDRADKQANAYSKVTFTVQHVGTALAFVKHCNLRCKVFEVTRDKEVL